MLIIQWRNTVRIFSRDTRCLNCLLCNIWRLKTRSEQNKFHSHQNSFLLRNNAKRNNFHWFIIFGKFLGSMETSFLATIRNKTFKAFSSNWTKFVVFTFCVSEKPTQERMFAVDRYLINYKCRLVSDTVTEQWL